MNIEEKAKKIQEFKQSVSSDFLNISNGAVLGTKEVEGKETGEKAIVFMVDKKRPESELGKDKILPKEINLPNGETVKTDVREGQILPMNLLDKLSWEDCNVNDPTQNRTKQRPIKGGTSICADQNKEEGAVGTLGCLVIDDEDGKLCALTNAHVITKDCWIPGLGGDTGRPADQLVANNVVDEVVYQGTESDGTKNFEDSTEGIGIVKRYSPMGIFGSVSTGGGGSRAYGRVDPQEFSNPANGQTKTFQVPRVVCDAALIALKKSVVGSDSWKQQGISSQGTSAPQFITENEFLNLQYDSIWGSFAADVGGGASAPPPMFISSRTTGPKEGDPKIKMLAPMMDMNVPFRSSVNAEGYGYTRFMEHFSYTAQDPSETDPYNVCFNAIEAGDSGSAIWAEINGTWKIVGLAFAGWNDASSGKTKLGFAIPMPIVAQVMNISAWDGNVTDSLFQDDNGAFTTDTIVKEGLSKIDRFTVGGNTYFLAGTVLGSKSQADIVDIEYAMDPRNNQGATTNIVFNDWLSQADDTIGYESKLYFNSNNNTANGGNPVSEYAWTLNQGQYVLSAVAIDADGAPFDAVAEGGYHEVQRFLDKTGLYALAGSDSLGRIDKNKKPTTKAGDPITWTEKVPSISRSTFQTGINDTVYSVNGKLTVPGDFDPFYLYLPAYPNYEPIKFKHDAGLPAGFTESTILDLKPYIAALSLPNFNGGIHFANNGWGNTVGYNEAHLIYPIFKYEDISGKGLLGQCARYGEKNGYTRDDYDWDHYEGWQCGRNMTDITQSKSQGHGTVQNGSVARYYYDRVHNVPSLIPIDLLEAPNTMNGTGYVTYGRAQDGVSTWGRGQGADANHLPVNSSGGWQGDKIFGTNDRTLVNGGSGTLYEKITSMDADIYKLDYTATMVREVKGTQGNMSFDKNNGYYSKYYVINPLWKAGISQYRAAHNIPKDSDLTTPYGHVFKANTSISNGSRYAGQNIDAKLNHLNILDVTWSGAPNSQGYQDTDNITLSLVGF